jgi:hypothetical protein
MRLINYNNEYENGLKLPEEAIDKAKAAYDAIETRLNKKYGKIAEIPRNRVQSRLAVIMHTLGDLRGKTILDIGCGAKNSWDYNGSELARQERFYDPWLCRVTRELGAMVNGIDGGSSPDEDYIHIKTNMLQFEEALKKFKENSIDLACAWSFFDSPSLIDGKLMFTRVVKSLEKKVKPEGFFIFESTGTGLLDKKVWEKYSINRGERK